ncbi:MAG: PKD domain-containing protein, partial [Chitinophagaceae bacterium]
QSSVPRGNLTNFQWNWADGNIANTAAPFAQYNFPQVPQDKIYPVKLVVTANSGCKDSTIVNVSVPAVYSITGNFDIQSFDVCTNEYFILTPNLVGAPANVTYVWDFADASGIVRTTGPVKKFFTYQNDYDVKLTVQLNGKTIYQTSRWVRANGQNIRPKALFLKNEVVADANSETWAFYSQSNIPHGFFTGYRWEFDDGRVDDNFNTYVEHKYTKQATEKTYKVLFIVTGNTGCKDTATGFVTIPPR